MAMKRIEIAEALSAESEWASLDVRPARRGGYTVEHSLRLTGCLTGGRWHITDEEAERFADGTRPHTLLWALGDGYVGRCLRRPYVCR